MNLFVKAKDLGGAEHTVICDDPKRALDVAKDEKATGCEVWVEDGAGQRLDDAALHALADQDQKGLDAIALKDERAERRQPESASPG